MISGTKISQLPVITSLQDTDYLPVQRGGTTNRISGLVLNNTTLSAVRANFPITYNSGVFTLSSDNTLSLVSNNITAQANTFTLSGTQVIETSSTSAALRITQTGIGNALVVEDSANPDSTPFAINQTGQIFSGTLSAWNALASLQITTDSSGTAPNSTFALKSNSNIAAGPLFVFYKGRGTHGAPLELSANDTLGNISFFGYSPESGTGNVPRYRSTAQIVVQTDGTPVSSLSSNPSRIMFFTTLSGESNVTERLRITHDGKVGIGTTAPNELLTVSGNVSANTVYAYLSGNAETTKRWQTSRLLTLSGGLIGAAVVDGTQDITLYTAISTQVIVNDNISDSANISDIKLAQITTPGKVASTAIDTTGSNSGDILISTGLATSWQGLSSSLITFLPNSLNTFMFSNESVTEPILATNSVTTSKLSANAVTTVKIADDAVTTAKIAISSVTLEKTTATAAAAPSTLVSRDSSGNLSATEITASLKGNAQTATSLQTPIVLQLSGDVNGQVTFNGSSQNVLLTSSLNIVDGLTVTGDIIGNNITTSFNQGSAVGNYSFAVNSGNAFGNYSFAEGNNTSASGAQSHAEGNNTRARGTTSHAAGSYAEAVHNRTWIWKGSTETTYLSTTRPNQFMVSADGGAAFFGNVGINTDSIDYALNVNGSISASNTVYAPNGNSDNWNTGYDISTVCQNASSNWESTYSTFSTNSANYILQNGNTNNQSLSVGTNDAFDLNFITASATRATFTSTGDLILNVNNFTIFGNISGNNLTTSFNQGSAIGNYSFAENTGTASGEQSHAEGYYTKAIGIYSHAEGFNTTAIGEQSHSEGHHTLAFEDVTHAEVYYTVAYGFASHAAGSKATALQDYTYIWSDGEQGTLTQNISTTRAAQYMVSASGGVFIPGKVGIGTDSTANALTVAGTISADAVITRTPLVFTNLSAYTLSLTNQSGLITINNSLTSFVYIPDDSIVNFGDGSQINITRLGTGTVTVSALSGVNLRVPENKKGLKAQNSTATLVKLSANDWLLFGDLI